LINLPVAQPAKTAKMPPIYLPKKVPAKIKESLLKDTAYTTLDRISRRNPENPNFIKTPELSELKDIRPTRAMYLIDSTGCEIACAERYKKLLKAIQEKNVGEFKTHYLEAYLGEIRSRYSYRVLRTALGKNPILKPAIVFVYQGLRTYAASMNRYQEMCQVAEREMPNILRSKEIKKLHQLIGDVAALQKHLDAARIEKGRDPVKNRVPTPKDTYIIA
jgi:hypothetical protein